MGFCSFAQKDTIFGVTPLDNLFIEEYMPSAPGGAVKVYLYGLKMCLYPHGAPGTLEDFARALGMDAPEALHHLEYWQQQGLLRIDATEPLRVSFYPLQQGAPAPPREACPTRYMQFNSDAQALFKGRMLTPAECAVMHGWMDNLGFTPAGVLMLLSYAIGRKDIRVSVKYIDAIATDWAERGLKDVDEIEHYLEQEELGRSGAMATLRALGIHDRLPSAAEMDLYRKWSVQWRFPQESIRLACGQTTAISRPNMKYVDKVLGTLQQAGALLPEDVQAFFRARKEDRENLKEVLRQLGNRSAVTPTLSQMYIQWTESWRFAPASVLLAAQQAAASGHHKIDDLERLLGYWHQLNLHLPAEIQAHLDAVRARSSEMQLIMQRAGISGKPGESHRRYLAQWTDAWHMDFEVILLAADYASKNTRPMDKIRYMDRLLDDWHQKGVATVAEAARAHEAFLSGQAGASARSGPAKQLDGMRYEQRGDSLEDIYYDL